MPDKSTISHFKQELSLTRAEEAEAVRRAHHLRAMGDSYADIRAAQHEADRIHSRVASLEQELHSLQQD